MWVKVSRMISAVIFIGRWAHKEVVEVKRGEKRKIQKGMLQRRYKE